MGARSDPLIVNRKSSVVLRKNQNSLFKEYQKKMKVVLRPDVINSKLVAITI